MAPKKYVNEKAEAARDRKQAAKVSSTPGPPHSLAACSCAAVSALLKALLHMHAGTTH